MLRFRIADLISNPVVWFALAAVSAVTGIYGAWIFWRYGARFFYPVTARVLRLSVRVMFGSAAGLVVVGFLAHAGLYD